MAQDISMGPALRGPPGLNDVWTSLPAPTVLWFCDLVMNCCWGLWRYLISKAKIPHTCIFCIICCQSDCDFVLYYLTIIRSISPCLYSLFPVAVQFLRDKKDLVTYIQNLFFFLFQLSRKVWKSPSFWGGGRGGTTRQSKATTSHWCNPNFL